MFLSLLFGTRDPESLRDRADEVSDPAGERYGAYLDRGALAASFDAHAALDGFLERCGMQRCDVPLAPWVETWSTSRAALVAAFGRDGANELLTRRSIRDVPALRRHSPALRGVEVSSAPRTLQPFALPARAPAPATRFRTGLAPDVVRRGYAIPDRPHGDGETIAVMALGGVPDRLDLERFWDGHGISVPDVRAVAVGPIGESADDPLARLETTMGVQWIGAFAQASRIVVYLVDPTTVADPWSTFLAAVLADRVHAPTIAVTSWSAPERQYHRVHGRAVFAELLDHATAIGVTVIAASGDWGAFDGMPRARAGGPRVCDTPAAHATFPGSEPRVLSVGGTHVIDVAPWHEHAWSAPIPATLRAATGLDMLAGSGGFSAAVPIPSFQRAVLREAYPRSSGAKAIATGRAQPDVALAAWGLDDGDRPTGYRCLLDGELRDDGGGTSVAAPIWAALIACLNEARRAKGKPRLGACAPLLYRIAQRTPHAFRAIVAGTTDIVLPVAEGRTELLPGFVASEGWNPAVGLGVPRGDALLAAVLQSPESKSRRETMALKARMYQRKHERSPRAVRKDYDFVELPMTIDVAPLVEELRKVSLPWIESLWKWHRGTQFCVLRAGPAGTLSGDEMITGAGVDAPILDALPSFREVLDRLFPTPAPLAWIGRSPPSSAIRMHIDNTQHWDEHHRLHIPLVTNPGARLCVLGRTVHMPAGTVWAFNNSRPHGAINTGPDRLHLVFDLPGSPAIDALLATGRPVRGELDPEAIEQLSKDPLAGVHEQERRPEVLARMLQQ